jgi:hypothetical protein
VAWLFNPDAEQILTMGLLGTIGSIPLDVAAAINVCFTSTVKSGHIRDTDHPEIWCPTFAVFAERYAKVLEDRRRTFDASCEMLGRILKPLDEDMKKILRQLCTVDDACEE